MRVRAPNIYQAAGLQDQFANISVVATSVKDPAIRSSRLTITLMDIEYGIDLDASHSLVEVEQGKTAKFSITIPSLAAKNAKTCVIKCCSFSFSVIQSL